MFQILILEDDSGLRFYLKGLLEQWFPEARIFEASDGQQALRVIQENEIHLALLDVDVPHISGVQVLEDFKAMYPLGIAIMLTAFGTISLAVESIRKGAFDFLEKPVQHQRLKSVIDKALNTFTFTQFAALSGPQSLDGGGRQLLSRNEKVQQLFHLILKLSSVDTPVLIRGPSGTGKELVARAIHFNSRRKNDPFVAINCAAIPENLLESELFGHERGAFTGAESRKIGKFEFAAAGTLFLDEIGDMPLSLQAKLLRVLQEKVFTPIGSLREVPLRARIISATHQNLEELIQKGLFREDLYYRLSVIPIYLPALKERIDDLDVLVPNLIRQLNSRHGRRILGVSQEVMKVLKSYHWPGNIRELENVLEYAFVLEPSNMITLKSLPENIKKYAGVDQWQDVVESLFEDQGFDQHPLSTNLIDWKQIENSPLNRLEWDSSSPSDPEVGESEPLDFNAQKEAFEKEFIIKALRKFKGKINQTALLANIPKKTLLRKIEKYKIDVKKIINEEHSNDWDT